jgi:hypothetical protein
MKEIRGWQKINEAGSFGGLRKKSIPQEKPKAKAPGYQTLFSACAKAGAASAKTA